MWYLREDTVALRKVDTHKISIMQINDPSSGKNYSLPFLSATPLSTLVFQLEPTVCLFSTLLLLDPKHFPKSEPYLIIGSVCQIRLLLGTSLYV